MAMSVQGIPETILLPGHDPVCSAAAALLAHVGGEPHRLAQYIVLLPHLEVAPDLSAALAAAAGEPLLLPRFYTLQGLASGVALPQPLRTDSQRESLLYQALRQRGWFEPAQLWRICDELLALFDDLTRQGLTLPVSLPEFERQLADAYAARASAPLHFEAALVHELWFAMVASDGGLDACSRYHLQLAQLAQKARQPLAAIGLPPLAPAETAFLHAWARREPVCILQPELTVSEAASRALQAALLPAEDAARTLGERASTLRAQLPDSPWAPRLELLPAPSLEGHACGIVTCIQAWLAAGKRSIGVVVLDRLVARRARALLERSQILVQDASGWAFSTTSASAAVMRWLEAAADDLAARPLLDVLKSPFVLPGWPAATRRAAVGRLEQRLRADSRPAGWLAQFLQDETDAGCRELLEHLQQAQAQLPDTPRPLAAWLRQLLASLAMLGIDSGFQADAAGRQLLGLLDGLVQELAQDASDYEGPAFQQWLQRRLERECFIDETLTSPVVFLPFSQVRMRRFDALLLAGADARHLPAAEVAQAFFNQAVRAQLGLPTREQLRAQARAELALMLAAAPHAVISWQTQKEGEYNLASPWIEQLLAFHEAAWGQSLPVVPPSPPLPDREPGALTAALRPQPVLPATRVPRTLSVAACQSLAACPYQFFARYGLGLARLGELDGQMDKRDYGAYVHQVLAQFHGRYPVLAGETPGRLETVFADLVEAAFAGCAAEDYMSQGWKQRLLATMPGYLAWQRDWEAAGWQIAALQVQRQAVLDLGGGRQLQLTGRIDRIDRQADGRLAVIDYTTQAAAALRRQAGQGKEAQLALAALLVDGPVEAALFLGLDHDRVEAVALEGDLQAQAAAARAALVAQVQDLYDGAALPATPGPACQYCEMGGLCRKEDWPPALDDTGGVL